MYFKLGNGIAWFFILLGVTTSSAFAGTQLIPNQTLNTKVDFQAIPANCVALRQGRTCFAKVSLYWRVPQKGNFCIYEKNSNTMLQCWQNSRGNTLQFEFESNEKIAYQLRSSEQNAIIAETTVDVSWVHKAAPRKRRWRLF